MQTRADSAIETLAHTAIGMIVGFVVTYSGYDKATTAALVSLMMVLASAIRQYLIRRMFTRFSSTQRMQSGGPK